MVVRKRLLLVEAYAPRQLLQLDCRSAQSISARGFAVPRRRHKGQQALGGLEIVLNHRGACPPPAMAQVRFWVKKLTLQPHLRMSALPPKADLTEYPFHVG
jgi:hypothetical protein